MNFYSPATGIVPDAPVATDQLPRLELRDLRKRLGDTAAVNGIDLQVAPGESVVLLGPSGCGKTTTLRMVAGFLQPEGGEIHLDGVLASNASFALPPEKRHLGMVFQTYAVWPHKTVADNVGYGLVVAGKKRAEIDREVAAVLDLVQLGDLAKRYPSELSGGQQQRVALARALATKPTLLLLDEPLSNLDASLRQEMRFELRALQKRIGITTLYVTHDQDEALVLADRVVVMNKGRIEQVGTPEEVYRTPASRFVGNFVGTANLLEGTIVNIDVAAGRVSVALDAGDIVSARASAGWLTTAAPGQRATLLLRPEDIRFDRPEKPDQQTGLDVRFVSAAFLGSRYELQLAAKDTPLRVQSRTAGTFKDGRALLWFRADSAWVVA
ncbi:iron(III) transport system ATP-binding protein/spermidine/putrescine transport system ATP-binding protein [Ancylobacter aquaticus]|uniref:Iron(III) transport system ATP-binding protein/spermidine/putrescine transport system ATP-binding protein n=1 Tax=Ancylobacter aquaticus TaxID=100 RepID=A0A4R1HDU6_ANCAQ|nr:ABC transporter ATP-binding protein [Ancylobacter aquaticus]TCK19728.1 iron(III) transport system ATP-binding protein/spermidine/putrescine transport system ATP-binding protein [Ancylobacter aquaticus]